MDFEKLGIFYMGRPRQPVRSKLMKTPLLYKSKNLTTHAVCVGMTVSGKTAFASAFCRKPPGRRAAI
jgi:hypothetical protein